MTSQARGSESATYGYVMGSKLNTVSTNFGGTSNSLYYGYSGDGKRLFRMLGSTVTHGYHWDAGYNVLNETDASGDLARTYVVAPKPVGVSTGSPMEGIMVDQGPVGMTLAEVGGSNPATGSYRYYAQDNIQSTRGLFDQSKASLGAFEFTPYGEDYTSAAPAEVTKRFTGLDLDAVTGQYYAPYRYYDPNLARWLTRDPLGMVDGPNVYVYARLNAITGKDVLGLASCTTLAIRCLASIVAASIACACVASWVSTAGAGCLAALATSAALCADWADQCDEGFNPDCARRCREKCRNVGGGTRRRKCMQDCLRNC